VQKSWGSGCVPYYHTVKLGNPGVIRGVPDTHSAVSSEFLVLKSDVHLSSNRVLQPGIFADIAATKLSSKADAHAVEFASKVSAGSNRLLHVTCGLSVRYLHIAS